MKDIELFGYIEVAVFATIESLCASCCANEPSRQLSNMDVYSAVLLSTIRSIPGLANDSTGNSRTTKNKRSKYERKVLRGIQTIIEWCRGY